MKNKFCLESVVIAKKKFLGDYHFENGLLVFLVFCPSVIYGKEKSFIQH